MRDDILAKLELDEIFLPVDDLERPALVELSDVSSPEPPAALLVLRELLLSLARQFVVAAGHVASPYEYLSPRRRLVRHSVVSLLPVYKLKNIRSSTKFF